MENFIILDIETTGLSAWRHRITEIAALKFINRNLVDEFVTLVNPLVPIPRFITRLTGIDDPMVRDKPTIDRIIGDLSDFMEDIPIVAHNATFDYNFIDYNMRKHLNLRFTNPKICTARLARRLVPFLPSKRLSSLCQFFDINNVSEHRAKGDSLATAEIFNIMLDMMKKRGIEDLDGILKLQRSRIQSI